MRFLTAVHTDVGTTKAINQDAFCLKVAHTPKAYVAMLVLCDGMGGLKQGELASALLINAFSNWFETVLPKKLAQGAQPASFREEWNKLIQAQNQKIIAYGRQNGISMGTTISGVLLINEKYLTVHVGDSRIYLLFDDIKQLTRDHTVVAHEVEQQRLTQSEARTDKRQNILLQCVGANGSVTPDFADGMLPYGGEFLLCSDGFRHLVQEDEMFGVLAPNLMSSERIMKNALVDLIELNKQRGEKDNITALLLKGIR